MTSIRHYVLVPFMSAAASAPDPTTQPSRSARLLDLVRKLIDYGKELAATIRAARLHRPRPVRCCFGTADVALILARITRGLHRANALEARLLRNAARLDARTRAPRAPSQRQPRAPRPAAAARRRGRRPSRPPAHAGADRRRGPPPADRRRHRRHLPRSRHPAEPSAVAGTAASPSSARRQPRRPGEGHPRPGVSAPGHRACRIAGTVPAIPAPAGTGPP